MPVSLVITTAKPYAHLMGGFLAFLLIAWLVLSVLGFVIKGLLWLTFVGIVLFVVTAIFLWLKRKTSGTTR